MRPEQIVVTGSKPADEQLAGSVWMQSTSPEPLDLRTRVEPLSSRDGRAHHLEMAQETGFKTSALRYYGDAGLVTVARSPAGYRTYDEASIETLRFITRAKGLGLSLDDISDLDAVFDDRRCEPVRDHPRFASGGCCWWARRLCLWLWKGGDGVSVSVGRGVVSFLGQRAMIAMH